MKKIVSILLVGFTLVGFNQAKSQSYNAPITVGAQGGAVIKDFYLYTTSTQSGETSSQQPIIQSSYPTSTNSIWESVYIQSANPVQDQLSCFDNTSASHVLRCAVLSTSYMNIVNNYSTTSITVKIRLNMNGGPSLYGPTVTIPASGSASVAIPTGSLTANSPLWITGTTMWPAGSFPPLIALYVISN